MSWSQALFDGLDGMYQDALHWALGHRKLVVLGVLVAFLGALALVPLIGTEFFPMSDESQFRITLRAPLGTRVEEDGEDGRPDREPDPAEPPAGRG